MSAHHIQYVESGSIRKLDLGRKTVLVLLSAPPGGQAAAAAGVVGQSVPSAVGSG
jgi:hypothetical protein